MDKEDSELPHLYWAIVRFFKPGCRVGHILMNQPGFEMLFSVIIAITGEIGNNSFDHNLGKWPDTPGIFLDMILIKANCTCRSWTWCMETLRQVRPALKSYGSFDGGVY